MRNESKKELERGKRKSSDKNVMLNNNKLNIKL